MSQSLSLTPTSALPAHSPLGASSAKRWMTCTGSVTLINLLNASARAEGYEYEPEDPDWRRDGIQAHELAAHCLNASIDTWEADPVQWPALTVNMMQAVQVYLDFVRSIRGYNQRFVEFKLHRSEFHEQCFGTVDCALQDRKWGLHVIDYKHGIGILVEVENNLQLMYYAFMVIDELDDFNDEEPVTLTIVQPRMSWIEGGKPRSWTTTVGYIKTWANEVLKPAMVRTSVERYLSTGEHCRFCPAKAICPGFLAVANKARQLTIAEVKAMSDEVLAACLADIAVIRMAPKMLMDEARHRTINQAAVIPGWKLVPALADRMWKDGAPVADKYGFQPQKIKSPAQVEDLEGGKEFVAEWAFRPDAGYELVPKGDRRKAIVIEKSGETFKKFLDNLKGSE